MDKTTIANIAFFDAEFTADDAKDRGVQEMIQCALIIYEVELSAKKQILTMSDEPIFTYSTFVKPVYNNQLSDYIKELTGISQEDVDGGELFKTVLNELERLVVEHDVKKILVWGPDRNLLKSNSYVVGCDYSKTTFLCRKVKDVSKGLSAMVGSRRAISQHKMCELLNISESGVVHSAYYDALNLSKIIREFCGRYGL